MFNLIPDQTRLMIRREYSTRFWIVLLSLTLVPIVVYICAFFPTYIQINAEEDVVLARMQTLQDSARTDEGKRLADSVARIQQDMVLLKIPYMTVTDTMNSFLALKTAAVSVSEISITRSKNTDGKHKVITVQGVAQTRQGLLDFTQQLKASNKFVSVDVPISNFALEKNIPFNLSLETNNE